MKTVSEVGGEERPLVNFDEIMICPKCGSGDLHRAYHRNAHEPGCDLFEFEPDCCSFEHHCRYCRGCGFEWAEEMPTHGVKFDVA